MTRALTAARFARPNLRGRALAPVVALVLTARFEFVVRLRRLEGKLLGFAGLDRTETGGIDGNLLMLRRSDRLIARLGLNVRAL